MQKHLISLPNLRERIKWASIAREVFTHILALLILEMIRELPLVLKFLALLLIAS